MVKLAEGDLNTHFGKYKEVLFYDGQKEYVVMTMGEVAGEEDVLCRLHSACIFGHYFSSSECTCREEMNASQRLIQERGKGIIILLDQEGKGNGHYALLKSVAHKRKGLKQAEAYEAAGFSRDARDYRGAATILKELSPASVRILTDNESKVRELAALGIKVAGIQSLKGHLQA